VLKEMIAIVAMDWKVIVFLPSILILEFLVDPRIGKN